MKQSTSKRAGINFPVGRIRRNLKVLHPTVRISPTAAVYVGAVLEYLVTELLELAASKGPDMKVKRMKPRHIRLALDEDEELSALCPRLILPEGGVLPHIHVKLIKEK